MPALGSNDAKHDASATIQADLSGVDAAAWTEWTSGDKWVFTTRFYNQQVNRFLTLMSVYRDIAQTKRATPEKVALKNFCSSPGARAAVSTANVMFDGGSVKPYIFSFRSKRVTWFATARL